MRSLVASFLGNVGKSLWVLPLVLIGLLACQNGKSSKIDHEKVDRLFGQEESQILFDHLYVVLDSLSYAQLTKNGSWREAYAFMDKGLPNFEPVDDKATTYYLRGHKHYIELLGPDNEFQEPVGKSGVGFSLHNSGEHFHLGVQPILKKKGTPYLSISETVDVPLGNSTAIWFKAFYSPSKGTALQTWYAFYNPGFLDSLHQTDHEVYSREAFLQKSYRKEQLFEGIKAITMTCTLQDYERIAQEMRHLGCRLLKREEGGSLTIASGDVSVTIIPSHTAEFSRITQIQCRLNAKDTSVTKLGNLTITNQGTKSVWNFENLYKNLY